MLSRIARAVAPFPRAMLFELRDRGLGDPYSQVVACLCSIRTRDEVSLGVARTLLARAPTPQRLAAMPFRELVRLVGPCTYARQKALQLRAIAARLERQLECSEEFFLALPGISPKCAHLVLGIACGQSAIGVDVHVHRVTNRWEYEIHASGGGFRTPGWERSWISLGYEGPYGRGFCIPYRHERLDGPKVMGRYRCPRGRGAADLRRNYPTFAGNPAAASVRCPGIFDDVDVPYERIETFRAGDAATAGGNARYRGRAFRREPAGNREDLLQQRRGSQSGQPDRQEAGKGSNTHGDGNNFPRGEGQAERAPTAGAALESLRQLDGGVFEVRLVLDAVEAAALERLRDLRAHDRPSFRMSKYFCQWVVEEMEKTTSKRVFPKNTSEVTKPYSAKIPKRVRSAIWLRDGGKCTYFDPVTNRKCDSTRLIQVDHILPRAYGGTNEPENLRLLCREHNLLVAAETFGAEFLESFRH